MSIAIEEPILAESENRYTLFPIKYWKVYEYAKRNQASEWKAEEIEYHRPENGKSIKQIGDGIELPKNTLMVFRHVLTTSREDRDGDILRTEGASVDPNMLLLWQHVHTLPIGKMLVVHDHTEEKLVLVSCIVDELDMAHDAAVMIDNGMGRFSHGFRALDYEPLEDKGMGFDIKEFEIMEESLVSVPSNVDADTEEVIAELSAAVAKRRSGG